mmetsp:Transcript_5031/g.16421  ORF Transcript_5031/g.16421 Transcript_5031/m.16421 type:complete len:306 (-) Transcript_5031:187-1104(-)
MHCEPAKPAAAGTELIAPSTSWQRRAICSLSLASSSRSALRWRPAENLSFMPLMPRITEFSCWLMRCENRRSASSSAATPALESRSAATSLLWPSWAASMSSAALARAASRSERMTACLRSTLFSWRRSAAFSSSVTRRSKAAWLRLMPSTAAEMALRRSCGVTLLASSALDSSSVLHRVFRVSMSSLTTFISSRSASRLPTRSSTSITRTVRSFISALCCASSRTRASSCARPSMRLVALSIAAPGQGATSLHLSSRVPTASSRLVTCSSMREDFFTAASSAAMRLPRASSLRTASARSFFMCA